MADVVVVGSLNMDLVVAADRWPGPGETVSGSSVREVPGGKGANQAAAAAALGAGVAMVGRTGRDAHGEALRASLARLGVDVGAVAVDAEHRTGLALVAVEASGDNRIVVIPGANGRCGAADVEASLRGGAWEGVRVVLLQLEVPLAAVAAAARAGRARGATVVLDPAPPVALPAELVSCVDLICPNQHEAAFLVGRPVTGVASARAAAGDLVRSGPAAAIVKLGAEGTVVARRGAAEPPVHLPGHRVAVVDTTAAGDAFAGALAAGLVEGRDLLEAAAWANRAAALSVTRAGAQTSLPLRREVEAFARPG